eukprot:scaffold4438_cov56-Cyclotella_meneghiniana.AAC.10
MGLNEITNRILLRLARARVLGWEPGERDIDATEDAEEFALAGIGKNASDFLPLLSLGISDCDGTAVAAVVGYSTRRINFLDHIHQQLGLGDTVVVIKCFWGETTDQPEGHPRIRVHWRKFVLNDFGITGGVGVVGKGDSIVLRDDLLDGRA